MQLSSKWQAGNKVAVASEVFKVKAVIKPIRGGCQAHLVEGEDGHYVAKFANNPQGNRT